MILKVIVTFDTATGEDDFNLIERESCGPITDKVFMLKS